MKNHKPSFINNASQRRHFHALWVVNEVVFSEAKFPGKRINLHVFRRKLLKLLLINILKIWPLLRLSLDAVAKRIRSVDSFWECAVTRDSAGEYIPALRTFSCIFAERNVRGRFRNAPQWRWTSNFPRPPLQPRLSSSPRADKFAEKGACNGACQVPWSDGR